MQACARGLCSTVVGGWVGVGGERDTVGVVVIADINAYFDVLLIPPQVILVQNNVNGAPTAQQKIKNQKCVFLTAFGWSVKDDRTSSRLSLVTSAQYSSVPVRLRCLCARNEINKTKKCSSLNQIFILFSIPRKEFSTHIGCERVMKPHWTV